MALELMNGIPIVPMTQLPARRDTREAPFFVEWSGRARGLGRFVLEREYRVIGTFRSGQVSLKAVPMNGSLEDIGEWQTRLVAVEAARQLNELHAKHRIDWSGSWPVIVPEGSAMHQVLVSAAKRKAEAADVILAPKNLRVSM